MRAGLGGGMVVVHGGVAPGLLVGVLAHGDILVLGGTANTVLKADDDVGCRVLFFYGLVIVHITSLCG